jgi:hypothetical protein
MENKPLDIWVWDRRRDVVSASDDYEERNKYPNNGERSDSGETFHRRSPMHNASQRVAGIRAMSVDAAESVLLFKMAGKAEAERLGAHSGDEIDSWTRRASCTQRCLACKALSD